MKELVACGLAGKLGGGEVLDSQGSVELRDQSTEGGACRRQPVGGNGKQRTSCLAQYRVYKSITHAHKAILYVLQTYLLKSVLNTLDGYL